MSNEVLSVQGQLVGIPAEKYEGVSGVVVDQVNKTIRADETVLWEGEINANGSNSEPVSAVLSETITNFEKVEVWGASHNGYPWVSQIWTKFTDVYGVGMQQWYNVVKELDISRWHINGNTVIAMKGFWINGNSSTYGEANTFINKVIGINRKA